MAEVAAGTPWVEGCRRANAAAAIKVTRRGPESAPTAAEVDDFLASAAGPSVTPDVLLVGAATSVRRSGSGSPTSGTTCSRCGATPRSCRSPARSLGRPDPGVAGPLRRTPTPRGRRADRATAHRGGLPGDVRRRDGAGARRAAGAAGARRAGVVDRGPRRHDLPDVQDETTPVAPSTGRGGCSSRPRRPSTSGSPTARCCASPGCTAAAARGSSTRSARAGSTTRTAGPTGSTARTPPPRSSTC